MSKDNRKIWIRDVINRWKAHDFPQEAIVRFPVRAPFGHTTPTTEKPSLRVRLDKTQCWVDVRVDDDGLLEIRGSHSMDIELHVSNSILVKLRDQ